MSAFPQIEPLILASGSPRRKELLSQLGAEFQVIVSDAPESENEHLTARELALLNAHRKARAVAKKHPDAVVLSADTVVHCGGKFFGKPASLAEARQMLRALQGETHQVVTGLCLLHLRAHRERMFADITEVTFRELSGEAIDRYLSRINPLDKAGAYGIQEHGELIVREISGSFSNVVGLPLERLESELRRW